MDNTIKDLDKRSYPLMMHLSIMPKYEFDDQDCIYDAKSQTSVGTTTMGKSWCTRNSSTFGVLQNDSDSFEDD